MMLLELSPRRRLLLLLLTHCRKRNATIDGDDDDEEDIILRKSTHYIFNILDIREGESAGKDTDTVVVCQFATINT